LTEPIRRIAITLGGGYVPGLAVVVRAAARAAHRRGWDVVGIRDGFDGLLFSERYPDGGVVAIDPSAMACRDDEGSLLGTGVRNDPFRLQQQDEDGLVEQVDGSGRVLQALAAHQVDACLAIVGGSAVTGSHALAVMWKLSRQGLRCSCIPKSAENDLAATTHAYGYDSILGFAMECLRRIRIAARDQGRVALVEVPGQYAGWLALQAGLGAGADVVLIPEFPYDVARVAHRIDTDEHAALIVVAEGAVAADRGRADAGGDAAQGLRAQLSPGSDPEYGAGPHVIHRAGRVAQTVYEELQRCSSREIFPLVLDQLVRAGAVSAADRALGAAYGAAAVQALADGNDHHLVAACGDDFETVPLAEAVNRIRTVEPSSPLLASARALGLCFGDRP
jgi:ATP-dependent phosphofructokinase / diphosphate-dependent phosphofructokinase